MPAVAVRPRLAPLLRRPGPTSTALGAGLVGRYDVHPYPRPRVQIAPGADLAADSVTWSWVDVTVDVRVAEGISIRRGRSDSSSQAEPANLRFSLNNPSGDYTPYLPTGRYYPYMRRNLPVRLFVDYGAGDVLRGTCFVDSYEPSWDPSLNMATVQVSASGLLRRLNQGTRPAQSLLTTWNLLDPQPIAYWPMEDSSGSTSFQEITGNNPPMLWDEAQPTFASAGPPASRSVVKLASATELRVDLEPYTSATSAWTLTFITYIPAAPSVTTPLIGLDTVGTVADWRIALAPSGGTDTLVVQGFGTDGTTLISNSTNFATSGITEPYGRWLLFTLSTSQNGSAVAYSMTFTEMATETSTTLSSTLAAATHGSVTGLGVHNAWAHPDWLYGHIALFDYAAAASTTILDGYNGEAATTRMTEACTYSGEAGISIVGGSTAVQAMGSWPVSTLIEILRECEAADGGVLYDARTPALGYRTRYSRYNQSAALNLGMTSGHVSAPFSPVDDDQRLRNEWTVSRSGGNSGSAGSSATYKDTVNQDAHGRYADTASLNIDDDAMLIHHAGWRVNLGAVAGLRYPQLSLDLVRNSSLAASWAAADIGDRITVTDLPAQHPPGNVDVIIEGYTETIGVNVYRVTANCSPYQPWEVFTVASATRGRIPTGGSSLAAAVTATGTTLSVTSPRSANLWTTTATYPADFPFDIDVGGEQMTVTAITGTSSPQSFTVTRSVNGVTKTHQVGTAVQIWRPAPIAL